MINLKRKNVQEGVFWRAFVNCNTLYVFVTATDLLDRYAILFLKKLKYLGKKILLWTSVPFRYYGLSLHN
jgi:hypothetical protein